MYVLGDFYCTGSLVYCIENLVYCNRGDVQVLATCWCCDLHLKWRLPGSGDFLYQPFLGLPGPLWAVQVPLEALECIGRIHYKAPSDGKWGEHECECTRRAYLPLWTFLHADFTVSFVFVRKLDQGSNE